MENRGPATHWTSLDSFPACTVLASLSASVTSFKSTNEQRVSEFLNCLFSLNCLIFFIWFFIAWVANGSHDGRQWWWSWWLTIILIMMMVMMVLMVLMVIIKPTVNDLQAEGGGHISCKIRVCDNFVWVPEMSVSVCWSLVSTIKSRNTEECNKSLEKATVNLPGTLHV